MAGTLFAVIMASKEENGQGWPDGQEDRGTLAIAGEKGQDVLGACNAWWT